MTKKDRSADGGGRHRLTPDTPLVDRADNLIDHAHERDQARKDAEDYLREHGAELVRSPGVVVPLFLGSTLAAPLDAFSAFVAARFPAVRMSDGPDDRGDVPGGYRDSAPPTRPGPGCPIVLAPFALAVVGIVVALVMSGWLR